MPATIDVLRNLPIFGGLSDDELERVSELCEQKTYDSGEYIFREGEPGNRLFIVLDGEVTWINPYRQHGENINPGMGVRFIELTPDLREEVVALVRTVAYLRDD